MKRILFYVLAAVFFLIAIVTFYTLSAYAGQVTLAWDANDPAPDGYRIFQRTQGAGYDYDVPAWQGKQTTAVIDGLSPGTTYYFVVRAFQAARMSTDSNEVKFTTGALPDAELTPAPPTSLTQDEIQARLNRIESTLDAILENCQALTTENTQAGFCGNPDSMIFHKESHWCGETAVRFNNATEAQAAGYQACGVCNPGKP